jgi:hypothetical protein
MEGRESILSSIDPERAVEGGVGGALYCPVTTFCSCGGCCGDDCC